MLSHSSFSHAIFLFLFFSFHTFFFWFTLYHKHSQNSYIKLRKNRDSMNRNKLKRTNEQNINSKSKHKKIPCQIHCGFDENHTHAWMCVWRVWESLFWIVMHICNLKLYDVSFTCFAFFFMMCELYSLTISFSFSITTFQMFKMGRGKKTTATYISYYSLEYTFPSRTKNQRFTQWPRNQWKCLCTIDKVDRRKEHRHVWKGNWFKRKKERCNSLNVCNCDQTMSS